MNKYHQLLADILNYGRKQTNKKGDIFYRLNRVLSMNATELQIVLNNHPVAKKKLKAEMELYLQGVTDVEAYRNVGIGWWDYCAPELVNSYPTYFAKLPKLIAKINAEKRPSKNYVLFIGSTEEETNQLPCLSLMQFQISCGMLHISVYQRSADSNLGLPSDIYHVKLIADMIDAPLGSITFFIGNAHIYANNIEATKELLLGRTPAKFHLNV